MHTFVASAALVAFTAAVCPRRCLEIRDAFSRTCDAVDVSRAVAFDEAVNLSGDSSGLANETSSYGAALCEGAARSNIAPRLPCLVPTASRHDLAPRVAALATLVSLPASTAGTTATIASAGTCSLPADATSASIVGAFSAAAPADPLATILSPPSTIPTRTSTVAASSVAASTVYASSTFASSASASSAPSDTAFITSTAISTTCLSAALAFSHHEIISCIPPCRPLSARGHLQLPGATVQCRVTWQCSGAGSRRHCVHERN